MYSYPANYKEEEEKPLLYLPGLSKEKELSMIGGVALSGKYKKYLNKKHKELICLYNMADMFYKQVRCGHSSELIRMSRFKYEEYLKEIYTYETIHKLLDIRNNLNN